MSTPAAHTRVRPPVLLGVACLLTLAWRCASAQETPCAGTPPPAPPPVSTSAPPPVPPEPGSGATYRLPPPPPPEAPGCGTARHARRAQSHRQQAQAGARGLLLDADYSTPQFLAYGTPRYGVRIAPGVVDGGGCAEILTGPGPGAVFGPHVRGWDVSGDLPLSSRIQFFAYGTLRYGVSLSDGGSSNAERLTEQIDRLGELITGSGDNPAPPAPRAGGGASSEGAPGDPGPSAGRPAPAPIPPGPAAPAGGPAIPTR